MYKSIVLQVVIALTCFVQLMAEELPIMRGIGQDFETQSTIGKFRLSDLDAKVTLITFGFSNCPDVCPITLGYLANLYDQLSDTEKQNIKILFISVDPEFDTIPHLKKYLAQYESDFIGISPTQTQLKEITKSFHISYEKVEQIKIPVEYNRPTLKHAQGKEYNVFNHSISILVLDQKKRVRAIGYSGENKDDFIKKLRTLFHEDEDTAKIKTSDFWIRFVANTAMPSALYGKITNQLDTKIELLAIQCPQFAQKSTLHLTQIKDNQAKMVHQKSIVVKANTTFEMQPQSFHTMLFGLQKKIKKGNMIDCELIFDQGIKKQVQAIIK